MQTGEEPVAAAVIVHEGRVLLILRAEAEADLRWQFPAGKQRGGESAEGTAVREAQEETGVTVRATRHLGERVHPATHRSITYTACEVISGTAHAAARAEVAEVAWCTRAEARTRVPYGFYGPVEIFLDSVLIP
ncbi:NUDIX hydrolase [Streptomyces nanshensis]|nr:NUDIX hydrolase [Streptomyces nanshensis]